MSRHELKEKPRRTSSHKEAPTESTDHQDEKARKARQQRLARIATDEQATVEDIDKCLADSVASNAQVAARPESPEPSAEDQQFTAACARLALRALREGRSMPPELVA